MVVKAPIKTPLFKVEGSNQHLSTYYSNGYITDEPALIRDGVLDLNKMNGGYFGKNTWANCLGSAVTDKANSSMLVYIPSQFRAVEDVKRWCEFIQQHYNFRCTYLGETFLTPSMYGISNGGYVRSHIIYLPTETWFSYTPYSVLLKVSMMRYLYRPKHFEHLINPIYDMVENKGMNPWDALFLGHFTLAVFLSNMAGNYDGGKALFQSIWLVPLSYPRSYEEMVTSFQDWYYVNNVFGFIYMHATLLTSQAIPEVSFTYTSKEYMANPLAKDVNWLYSPHEKVFLEKFSATLKDSKWGDAYKMYGDFIQGYKRTFELLNKVDEKKWVDTINGRVLAPIMGLPGTHMPNCTLKKISNHVLKHIKSFE